MAHLDKELAGYWAKLPMIRRLMLSHPEIEWIWWLDSDAMFTDMVFQIPLSKYDKHNLVIHGYPDLLFDQKSWIALNTGSFLFRNCQWSLDLLDAWAPMGPKGPIREEAGKILTANLKGRPAFEADDQSALIYLLLSQKDQWMDKVYIENQYYLHGYWAGLVDRYEEMIEKYHPGLGDERWPFVTHFVGCKPCGSYGDYPVERCLRSMERAFNFADNQVLNLYGFGHRGLLSPKIKRIRNETVTPLEYVDQFDIRRPVHGNSGSRS
jgi:xyloglucan 6-xylosyltransferase